MCPRRQRIINLLCIGNCAHRETAADALGHTDDVGLQIKMLVAKPAPRTPKTGLDLVEHQQRATVATELLCPAQVITITQVDAAFALHHFQHHHRGLIGDNGVELLQIIVGDMADL